MILPEHPVGPEIQPYSMEAWYTPIRAVVANARDIIPSNTLLILGKIGKEAIRHKPSTMAWGHRCALQRVQDIKPAEYSRINAVIRRLADAMAAMITVL